MYNICATHKWIGDKPRRGENMAPRRSHDASFSYNDTNNKSKP